MFFRRGISLLPVVGFTIPLFLISAASAATSSSFQGLTASPSRVSFGNIQVGSSQTQYETLTNSGNSTLTISRATLTGGGFSFSGLSLPLSLSKGQSVTFRALFTPKLGGNTSGALAMVSDASNPNLTIALFGTGITAGQLTSSATALNFGRVTVGTSKTLTATLTATNASVTVSSVTSTSPEFRMGAFSVPTTIAAGQSASFTLTFKPQASGTSSGSISISSNAVNSPTVETLTGSGTAAPPHSVGLRWPPGPSAVVGYNVYRSATSGGPYAKINSAMNASTSYMDSSVQRATTYYYVYTVVDSSGVESKYSNQVQAVIPSP
jgi:ASPM-SPD-2-Hydin domain-containing protein/centrosomal CEP192-like protein